MGIGIAIAGLFLSVAQARDAKQRAKREQAAGSAFDARSAKLESKAILEEAELEAIEIRREGKLLGKKQTALTAKAGLKLGRGTAAAIQEETRRLTAKDVATTLESAERKSEQLLTTFGAGTQEVVSKSQFQKFTKFQQEQTALSEGNISSSNFIKSPKKPKTALTGL
jgi:hypothetical protein